MPFQTVPFVNLGAQFDTLEAELTDAFQRVCRSGMYILGDEVERFEQSLAKVCNTREAITVANGTDALVLALKLLGVGPGDEVITAPNSFVASAGAIAAVGATIRFADVAEDFNLDPASVQDVITPNTKVVIAVHLTGNPADIDAIRAIADPLGISVIEDAAQAINAQYKNRKVGGLGHLACFSLHPLKNFHLMGDAGFISTDDVDLASRLRRLRNHGLVNRDESVEWGLNSRLDAMQAAFGNIKIKYLSQWTERFREIACFYRSELEDIIQCPKSRKDDNPVYHNYIIQHDNRDKLMRLLKERGVDTKIHYPILLHMMPAAADLGYGVGSFPNAETQSRKILSLPIYPELTDIQVEYVIEQIKLSLKVI